MASRNVNTGPVTPATRVLMAARIPFRALPYDHDAGVTAYGAEAVVQLGLAPEVVFKTLVVSTDTGRFAMAVVPVSGAADLKAVASALGGKKARLADARDVERLTGYVLGGVSPIGTRTKLDTVIDDSAVDLDTMYVSGGRRGFDIAVAPHDLLRVTGARTARIRR